MGLFSSSSSATNDPMVGFFAAMQQQAAQQSERLGADWLSFAKQQFGVANNRQAALDAQTKAVTDQQLQGMKMANDAAVEDRARYKSVFLPLQDQYIDKAQNWDSPEAQANAAAQAKADVTTAYAGQKDQAERAMAARGVRPDSGVYAGTTQAADTQAALGAAGAQNMARRQLIKEGMALRGNAINIGANLPGQANTNLTTGLNAGTTALGNSIATEGNFRANTGIMNTGYEGALTGVNNAGQMYNSLGQNRANILNASDKMRNDSTNALIGAVGSAVGTVGGMAMTGGLSAPKSVLGYVSGGLGSNRLVPTY